MFEKPTDRHWFLSKIDLIIPKNKYTLSAVPFFIFIRLFIRLRLRNQTNGKSRCLQSNVPIQFVLSITHRFDIFNTYYVPSRFRLFVNVIQYAE